eukprot:1502143-Rhodomonas_salina.1
MPAFSGLFGAESEAVRRGCVVGHHVARTAPGLGNSHKPLGMLRVSGQVAHQSLQFLAFGFLIPQLNFTG